MSAQPDSPAAGCVERCSARWYLSAYAKIIAEGTSFDPNRDPQYIPPSGSGETLTPLSYLVGPVEVEYTNGADHDDVVDLSSYIDNAADIAHAITGELSWHYNQGFCTVKTPWVQGFTGFLPSTAPIDFPELRVRSANTYATVMVVSMDEQPLAVSTEVLVQLGTIARSTGWQTTEVSDPDPANNPLGGTTVHRIDAYGGPPWQLVDNAATMALYNEYVTTATALTPNGMLQEPVTISRDGQWVTFTVPADTKYIVLQQ